MRLPARSTRHLGVEAKKTTLSGGRKKVKPDIVVHRRDSDDHNLLVIEVKVLGRGRAQDRGHAHDKLSALVYGDEFRYRYGLFLELGLAERVGSVADAKWYVRNIE